MVEDSRCQPASNAWHMRALIIFIYVPEETGFTASYESRKLASYKNQSNASRDFMKFIRNVFASWVHLVLDPQSSS